MDLTRRPLDNVCFELRLSIGPVWKWGSQGLRNAKQDGYSEVHTSHSLYDQNQSCKLIHVIRGWSEPSAQAKHAHNSHNCSQ